MRYVQQLKEFIEHMDSSVEEMMDNIMKKGYESKYDLNIKMNGQSINIELNADTYERFNAFITGELIQAYEDNIFTERLAWLADYQTYYVFKHKELFDGAITFMHMGHEIYNPFLNMNSTQPVDPYEYYDKSFTKSQWLTEPDKLFEKLRMAAIDFLVQHGDNLVIGQSFDDKMLFETAVDHFVWLANSKLVENNFICSNVTDAMKIINAHNMYWPTIEVLFKILSFKNKHKLYDDIIENGIKT